MGRNLSLLCGVLVVCLVGAEAFLRVLGFGRPLIHEYDPELLWRMPAGQVAYAPTFDVEYRTNSQGWRDDAVAARKDPGEFRILALGDSVVFGHGIDHADTFTERMESRAPIPAGYTRLRVINTAVSGHGLYQYERFLATDAFDYAPDLIVIGLVKNDILSRADVDELRARARDGRKASIGTFRDRARRLSALAHAADGVFQRIRSRWRPEPQGLHFRTTPATDAAWVYAAELLEGIVEEIARHDVPLLLVVFPSPREEHIGIDEIRGLQERLGFHLVDLGPAFALEPREELFLDPVHPTRRGHAIAALTAIAYAEEHGLLAARP